MRTALVLLASVVHVGCRRDGPSRPSFALLRNHRSASGAEITEDAFAQQSFQSSLNRHQRRRLVQGGCDEGQTTVDCIGLLSGCCANWLNENPVWLPEAGWVSTPVGAWIIPQEAEDHLSQSFVALFTISNDGDLQCAKLQLEIAASDEIAALHLNDAPIPTAPHQVVDDATLTPVTVAMGSGLFVVGLNSIRINVTNRNNNVAALFVKGHVQLLCSFDAANVRRVDPWLGPVNGNTLVAISFHTRLSTNSGAELTCSFGVVNPVTSTIIEATQLLCRSPSVIDEHWATMVRSRAN